MIDTDNLQMEFESSFGNYVDGDRDDRSTMLKGMVKGVSPTEIVELFEVHDFAAMLTSCVYVSPGVSSHARRALEDDSAISAGTLSEMLEIHEGNTPIEDLIAGILAIDEGCAYLTKVAFLLSAAHDIPGLRVNIAGKPS